MKIGGHRELLSAYDAHDDAEQLRLIPYGPSDDSPTASRPRTKIVPVGVPERTGVAFVEASVSVSVSFEVAEDGISETNGGRDMEDSSGITPNPVGAVISAVTSVIARPAM